MYERFGNVDAIRQLKPTIRQLSTPYMDLLTYFG